MATTIPEDFHVGRAVDGYTIYVSDDPAEANTAYVTVHDGEPRRVDVTKHPWEDMDDFVSAAIEEFQASYTG